MFDEEGWSKKWWSDSEEAAFNSKTEVNLESTNYNEFFSKMEKSVLEHLANKKYKDVIEDSVEFWFWIFTRQSMIQLAVPLIFHFQRSSSKESDYQS